MTRRRPRGLALSVLTMLTVLTILGAATVEASPASATTATTAGPGTDDLVWSVQPTDDAIGTGRPNFGYRADPGARVHDSLDVTNRGTSALTLRVYAADAFSPQGGGIDVLRPGEESTDVGAWIAVSTDSITVQPQQTIAVPFTLTVPADATPGDHAGGIVTTSTTGSGTFAVERRLGSRVQVRVAGALAPRLEVSHVALAYGPALDPFSSSTTTIRYTVANTGNVRLDAHPTVHLAGPGGILGRTVATPDLGELLPGSSRRVTVRVPAVWALGHLSATVTLAPFPANPNDSAAQLDLRAATASGGAVALNWGQVALLLLVVLLVVGGGWRRRAGRARVQAAVDEAVRQALSGTEPPVRADRPDDDLAEDVPRPTR